MKAKLLARQLRLEQWIKNCFVFAGLIFSHQRSNPEFVIKSIITFISFSFISSCIYTINDCFDYKNDQKHPSKKKRPIASGAISIKIGYLIAFFCFIISTHLSYTINLKLLLLILTYFLINICYSVFLKKMVIIDVFCIAVGFVLRMLAGTYAIDIPPSSWIIICTVMISLFLGFSKRYAEIEHHYNETRSVLKNYDPTLLSLFLGITASGSILSYALYTVDAATLKSHQGAPLIFTLPLVIYGLFRYLFLVIHQHKGEIPNKEILKDSHLLVTLILYIIFILLI